MDKFMKFILMFSSWISISYVLAYNYQDFNDWNTISSTCGKGKRQSPIDLEATSKIHSRLPLIVKNYNEKLPNAKVYNTGHLVKVTGDWGKTVPTVTGSLVNNEQYLLYEVHLHWSDKDDSGSEHNINGKQFSSEVHFVHYNSKYKSPGDAATKVDGLLVIGLIYTVNTKTPNAGLAALSKLVATVPEVSSTSAGTLDLSLFRVKAIRSFYSYLGSLTTPPCSETVRWVVSNEVLSTNAAIMKVIRSTKMVNNDTTNVRPLQPLNGREVILYKK